MSIKSKIKNTIIGLFLVILFSMASSLIESIFLLPNFNNDVAIQPQSEINLLRYIVLALVVAPILEELIFRGWLLSKLKKKFSFKCSNVICAFIFAALHLDLYILPYFFNGLVYGWVREKNNSISSAIILHALYNTMAVSVQVWANG